MSYRFIVLSVATILLSGCARYGTFEHSNHSHNSRCKVIQRELNQMYNGQIASKPPITERAKLLREYDYYGCND